MRLDYVKISPNNPLKVLHSFLELDYKNIRNKEKIDFVGISNWKLDASKMNRGIYLAVTEPDEKDCIETAIEIANSYDDNLGNEFKDIFILLGKSYVSFVNENLNLEFIDFHGTRDFYHFVKLTARTLKKEKDDKKNDINFNFQMEIIRKSIQRNIGGYKNSIKNFELNL